MLIVTALFACDDNDVLPAYEKKGDATSTTASVSFSNTKPVSTETITVTLKFVNLSEDKIKSVVLKAKIGSADYAEVQTFDENSAATEKEIIHEVPYTVTAAKGTVITFDMVITSQKEYPQIKRSAVTVN
jgi:outer membrane lipopolysaccharide assembly protein LptE/RlpB